MDFLLFPAPVPSYDKKLKDLLCIPFPCLYFDGEYKHTCIYFHGNATDIGECRALMSTYSQELELNILCVEYPGYGIDNDSIANEESINRVAVKALDYLHDDKGVAYNNIVVFGCSIGTGPAVYLANKFPRIRALVLRSPYLSIKNTVSNLWHPCFAWFVNERWDSASIIESIECPTIVFAGKEDKLIPAVSSRTLYDISGAYNKKYQEFDNEGHVGNVDIKLIPALKEFLSKL